MTTDDTITKAIDHFRQTGEINDTLIPYFTQHGKWFGDRRGWKKSMWRRAAMVMGRAHLPGYRRTALNARGEPILLTSFRWRRRRPVDIPWFEVRGAIWISGSGAITATNLRSVAGYFHSRTDSQVELPKLTSVGGDLDLRATWKLCAPVLAEVGGSLMVCEPNLPRLEAVGKRFWVCWANHLRLPMLRHVGGSFEVAGAGSVFVPVLKWVGFDLKLSYLTTVFSAPRLEAVGFSLVAGSAKVIHAARLKSVGDALYTASAMDYYQPDFDGSLDWEMHPDARARWLMKELVRQTVNAQPHLDI